jgi:SAM-dependent MidA family methyltransferase
MARSAADVLLERIRSHGPITVAEFMEIALYHPEHGYYASAQKRSGKAGDFFTSVDVGPLFGRTVAVQIAGMYEALAEPDRAFDLVEAGAGDGRLMCDVLDELARRFPECYRHARVTLVERSAAARRAQRQTLAGHADRLAGCGEDLPSRIDGVILANELLDAMPLHVVQFEHNEVREVCVTEAAGALIETFRPLANQGIAESLSHITPRPAAGQRAEVNLSAIDWVRRAATALGRGYVLIADYGAEEAGLVSPLRPSGTLTAYRRHMVQGSRWLDMPGHSDLTGHVNFTALRRAALDAGLTEAGAVDQCYFLMNLGILDFLSSDQTVPAMKERLAAQSLLMPGGLGTTMKVMAFAKGVRAAGLRGFSSGRVT